MNRLIQKTKRVILQHKLKSLIADMKFYINNIYDAQTTEDDDIIDELIAVRISLKEVLQKLDVKIEKS